MANIYGKSYYIDIDGITEKCRTGKTITDEDGDESLEINIFKYEILKMCLERVINDYPESESELGVFNEINFSPSFKIAFNTLIKNEIIKEETEEDDE